MSARMILPVRSDWWVTLGAVALSWLGFVAHNLADLPGQTLASPETAYPTLVYLLLVLAWCTPGRRVAARLLWAWGLLQLVGGAVLSVLPLPILPYEPARTLYHYAFHALYGLVQLPLLIVLAGTELRRGRSPSPDTQQP